MADESRGMDAGVSKTPIYVDDKGRRRRGDVQSQDPNNLSSESQIARLEALVASMQQEIVALKSNLATLRSDYDSDIITGPGHSGSGKGKQFNPNVVMSGSAAFDCEADPPTATFTFNAQITG